MKRFLIILTIGFWALTGRAQILADTAFQLPTQEKLHYKIYYHLGKIWINAGIANFTTDTLTYRGKQAYRFIAEGFSLKKYSWIYNLQDYYNSVVERKSLMPLRFEKENTEGGVWVHNIYNFNWEKGNLDLFMEATKKDPVHRTITLNGFITDALSALYYIRTWDFNRLKEGDTLVFKSILDGKIFDQYMVYAGRETVKTKTGEPVAAFKLKAIIKNSTFFRSDEAVTVWIANNNARWLIKVKAAVVVGSIMVYLDKQGLVSFGPEK